VPIVADYVNSRGLFLMQDNARGHAARATLDFIRERGLIPIFWTL
jgi:hypothetical protein